MYASSPLVVKNSVPIFIQDEKKVAMFFWLTRKNGFAVRNHSSAFCDWSKVTKEYS